MNTNTVNKKAKKRPFSEVAPIIKLEKQEDNANESKKGQKKTKSPIAVGNGNPRNLGNKEQNLKGMGKQKKKPIKKMQQNNVESSETGVKEDTKEDIKLSIDEFKVETQKSRKRKFEEISKKDISSQKLQKEKPQKKEAPKIGRPTRILTVEMIAEKIEEIESRDVLTKTAKRKLAKLRKLCAVGLEGKSNTLDTTEIKSEKKNKQNAGAPVKNKQKAKAKVNLKMEDQDDMDESDEDQSEQETDDIKEEINDESVEESNEDEEDEEMKSEDEDEEVEDEQDEEEEEDEDDEDNEDNEDDEDDDDEDDEDDEDVQTSIPEVKKKGVAQSPDLQKKEDAKKKRYVLFVGNLPFDITADELKQHFLTKVDEVISVRIPTREDKKSRGIAFVELTNQADYNKGISLNHTFLKKRKINVQCTTSIKDEKKANPFQMKAINKIKLDVLRSIQKSRKFADGDQKKNPLKKK